MSRSHQAVHETRGDHPYPEMVPHQPQNTRHGSRRAETREDRTAGRRDACKASATESSFLSGRVKTVTTSDPRDLSTSVNQQLNSRVPTERSTPQLHQSPTITCVTLRSPAEREREPCPSESHTHTYKNVVLPTHASSKEKPIPMAKASSISAWSSRSKGRCSKSSGQCTRWR